MHGSRNATSRKYRFPHRWRASTAALACFLAAATGCARSIETEASDPAPAASGSDLSRTTDLEAAYLIGPDTARELGYRIKWQYPYAGANIRTVSAQGDSVFVIDGRNFLTRLDREEGRRIWSLAVGTGPLDEILGITYIPREEKIILTTGGALLLLDSSTGSQIGKQKLEKIANTAPLRLGNHLVYGSRNGQLCWHAWDLDAPWRSYQVSPSIKLPPVYEDGKLIVVGNDGRIMVLMADLASQLWSRKLLDRVVAGPVAGRGVLYVADLNHTLWAFDLNQQRSALWHYLTESPLTESPVLLGDRVYQHIPTEGLVCFEARPVDSPGGKVIWSCEESRGNVVFQRGNELYVWDDEAGRMEIVDATYGSLIRTVNLARASHLLTSNFTGSELYAAGADGRVIRLTPRN
ncbi:MAG: PQQ-binding-like beta-propeller repeat protein [Phycisphaerales bacterium]|nr:MAG: PQQ-binding-like beta-propeller repeat protein [Phycisphaerales bacterium]